MQASAAQAHVVHRNNEKHEQSTSTDPIKHDAYQAILNSTLPPVEKKPNRLAQEILTLLVGGSATSSYVMTRMTFHLTSSPAILGRLREELKTIMPDPFVTPELEKLEQSKYLVSLNRKCPYIPRNDIILATFCDTLFVLR
jgi:cytochrome P450